MILCLQYNRRSEGCANEQLRVFQCCVLCQLTVRYGLRVCCGCVAVCVAVWVCVVVCVAVCVAVYVLEETRETTRKNST
jgi:hypothetical protein